MQDDIWWGYSLEHGSVALDRTITQNRPGSQRKLLFVRCRDWVCYEENRESWNPPNYVYGLVDPTLIEQFRAKKIEIYASLVHERHSVFLQNNGLTVRETKYAKSHKRARVSVCWNCHKPLNNVIDLECSACEWIVCGACGACGCGYKKDDETNSNSELPPFIPMPIDEEMKKNQIVFDSFQEASKFAKNNPGQKLSRTTDGHRWKVE